MAYSARLSRWVHEFTPHVFQQSCAVRRPGHTYEELESDRERNKKIQRDTNERAVEAADMVDVG